MFLVYIHVLPILFAVSTVSTNDTRDKAASREGGSVRKRASGKLVSEGHQPTASNKGPYCYLESCTHLELKYDN